MAISLEQAKNLRPGDELWLIATNPYKRNKICRVKVNGQPKTWKTRPSEVKIPYKHGLYEYGYITNQWPGDFRLEGIFLSEDECRAAYAAQLELDGGIK